MVQREGLAHLGGEGFRLCLILELATVRDADGDRAAIGHPGHLFEPLAVSNGGEVLDDEAAG